MTETFSQTGTSASTGTETETSNPTHTEPPTSLELVLGDPFAPGPNSFDEIVAADERRELSAWAENALRDWGFNLEFVPASLGGRWVSTTDLVTRLRPVFRRDAALGLGFGLTSLMAAVNVWVAAAPEQKQAVANILRRGDRIAVGFHESDHGNDFLGNTCRATLDGENYLVSGHKQVINNIDRAQHALLFVRTRPEPGPRSNSLLLWSKSPADQGHADTSKRYLTAGMRGCMIGGATFDELPVPTKSVIGTEGLAAETALKAFQVTRAVVPALAVGSLDSALRLAVDYSNTRRLYKGTVAEIPHARSLIAQAAADLLIADAFSGAVVRSLHVHPRNGYLLSAASKYLVPTMLNEAMRSLSVLMGSTFYAKVDPYEAFEKFGRDLQVVPIGHAGATACLLSIVPNLKGWLRRRARPIEGSEAIFRADLPLDELDFGLFEIGPGAGDPLMSTLDDAELRADLERADPDTARRLAWFAEQVQLLVERVSATEQSELGTDATPAVFGLARRFALLQAAGACAGVWHAAFRAASGSDASGTDASEPASADARPIAADWRWLSAALQRLEVQLRGRPAVLDDSSIEFLVERSLRLARESRSLGLDETPVYRDPSAPDARHLADQ